MISKIDKPTAWRTGMVVVPKKSGAVRICVNLNPLNENVLREVHPMPKVDKTLAQLAGTYGMYFVSKFNGLKFNAKDGDYRECNGSKVSILVH